MAEKEKRKRGRPRADSWSDIWFGVEDARERKRIQDRLAQRARRTRLLGQATNNANENARSSSANRLIRPAAPKENGRDHAPESSPLSNSVPSDSALVIVPTIRINQMRDALLGMSADHYFLCFSAWPIYSALGTHGLMQGTNCENSHAEMTSPSELLSLPEALRPSPLQLVISHRRWIDRFPFPRMRDNMILLNGILDLDEFVRDLFEMASLLRKPNSSQPTWDPDSWTLGTEFSAKWGYLFL